MNLQSFLVLVVLFVLLGLAVAFIAKNGGWQGGCSGHCASCQQRCAQKKKKSDSDPDGESK